MIIYNSENISHQRKNNSKFEHFKRHEVTDPLGK